MEGLQGKWGRFRGKIGGFGGFRRGKVEFWGV